MRRRLRNDNVLNTPRPSGALDEGEIKEISRAYTEGCTGEVVIGMRGEERVMILLLPAMSEAADAQSVLKQTISKLREMGCDRYVRISKCNKEGVK